MEFIQSIQGKFRQVARHIKRFKLEKIHIEYVTGILTIPVLITAILLNYGNLNSNKAQQTPAAPTPQIIVVPETGNKTQQTVVTPVQQNSTQSCQKTVGPISINYPTEGQTVSDNPVCVIISYPNNNYCSVVWSYRINNGTWSDYNNGSPCLYNLPNGNIKFELRVNSTTSSDTQMLTRNFTYNGGTNTPTPTSITTPTPVPTLATPVPTTVTP